MNRIFRYLLLAGALALTSSAAFADVFYFNYSGAGVSATGNVTGSMISANTFSISDMSGFRNGAAILGVMPTSNSGFIIDGVQWTFDNLGYASSPIVDTAGILFNLAGNPTFANIYSVNNSLFESVQLPGYQQYTVTPIDLSISTTPYISTTPEPGSLILFGSGALAMAGMIRRKLSSMNPLSAVRC